jgi:hypothetical protein
MRVSPGSVPRWRAGWLLAWALFSIAVLGGTGQSAVAAKSNSSTTGTNIGPVLKPSPVRTAKIYVPPGRAATKGPIGANPTRENGLELNILSGLAHDEPIYNGDFADPTALPNGNTLYFYASSSQRSKYDTGANLPMVSLSRGNGFSGRFLGDALPKVPVWTVPGYQWGPDVWARSNSSYVLYYSTPATVPLGCLSTPPAQGCVKTVNGTTNAECISRATASSPTGPFVDNSTSAFVCPLDQGGAIDPAVFVDSKGIPWLLWKSDGDCCDEPTSIYSQQLSSDGLTTVGPPHRLIGATQAWEDHLVEAPTMIQDHDHFWLFYSGSLWGHPTYGIGIARCDSVVGPCTKPLDHSWVASHADGVSDQGPGGEEFYQTGSIVWMVHHGLAPGQTGNSAQRRLYVDLIAFPPGGLPHVAAREPAGALAAAEVYFADPALPKRPDAAYLKVMHLAGVSASASKATLVAAATTACTDFRKRQHFEQIVSGLETHGLTTYEAYLALILAAQYHCPARIPEATKVMSDALNQLPSAA